LLPQTGLREVDGSDKAEVEAETDENGEIAFRGFYGRYRVEFKVDGELRSREAHLKRGERNVWSFNLPG